MKTDLSRRDFLEPALGTAILLLIPGCGGGEGTSLADSAAALGKTSVNTPNPGCGSTIDFNHGHALTVLKSDLDSPTAKSYDIQGTADHTHTVSLTVAQLATLKTGTSVTAISAVAYDHQHVITVSCV